MILGLKPDKKALVIILALLGALIIAAALTSCSLYYETGIDDIPRQHVNEQCRVFRNHWDGSDVALMQYVYRMVNGTNWVRMRVIRWTGADCGTDHRRGRIAMVVVYYE